MPGISIGVGLRQFAGLKKFSPGVHDYLRPDTTLYRRPDGTSLYKRPAS